MLPFPSLMCGVSSIPPLFGAVGGAVGSSGTTVTPPAGTSAGDLLILLVSNQGAVGSPTGNAGAWTNLGTASGISKAFSGIATGASNITFTSTGTLDSYLLLVLRGAFTTATLRTENSTTPGGVTTTATGFAKAGGCRGIITSIMQYGGSNVQSLQAATDFSAVSAIGGGFETLHAAFSANPATYTNGTNLTWNCAASQLADVLMIELT